MIGTKIIFGNIKIIVLLSFLLMSIYLITSSLFFTGAGGIAVAEIESGGKCANVKIGSSITQIEGTQISKIQDFNQFVGSLRAGQYISMVVDGGPANCVVISDGNMGIKVRSKEVKTLGFGTDLVGGTVYSFVPNETLDENGLDKVVNIVKSRISFSGFQQTEAYRDGNLIKIKSSKDADLSSLTMVGKIEASVLQEIEIKNGSGKIKIGSESFPIIFEGNRISMNNLDYGLNEEFEISDISFVVTNFTKNSALVETGVFSDEDINSSQFLSGTVEKIGDNYRYAVPIELKNATSFKFSQITRGMSASRQPGKESVLNGQIVFYLDGESITFPLDIPLDIAGKPINVIIGFEKTEKEAYAKMNKLKSVLTWGRMPSKLILRGEEPFKASVGAMEMTLMPAGMVSLSLILIVAGWVRYKNIVLAKAVLLAVSGIVCTLGFVALVQRYSSYSPFIDFPMLAGLLVSSVFVSIKFFISAEEKRRGTRFNIKFGYKKTMGLNSFLNVVLIIVSVFAYSSGIGSAGSAIIIYLSIEILLLRMIYNDSLKKSFR